MRVHTEFVHKDDIIWKEDVFQEGFPIVKYKYLSFDEITNDFSALVALKKGNRYDKRVFNKDQELFVLSGEIETDEYDMKKGCYLRIPAGFDFPEMDVKEESEVLWMGDLGNTSADNAAIVFKNTEDMEWEIPFVKGPFPGLFIKLLWRDPVTKAYSRLIKCAPGWLEKRIEYHDCMEEAYTIQGEMVASNWPGVMDEGCYFWRPPGVLHGPMMTGPNGCISFIRTDGELVNHYCYRHTRRPKDY